MKYILLFSLTIFILISTNAQDQGVIINNDSIYSSLLPRHIEYLKQNSNRQKYLNDTCVYVNTDYPLNKIITIDSKIWKIKRISIPEIEEKLKSAKYFYAIEYRPMYFNNGKIIIKIHDLCISEYRGEVGIAICGSTTFVFDYDCENGNYKLIDEYNK